MTRRKPHGGRPRALDGPKKGKILAMRAVGLPFPEIARRIGCARGTIRNEAGRDPDFATALARCPVGRPTARASRAHEPDLRTIHANP